MNSCCYEVHDVVKETCPIAVAPVLGSLGKAFNHQEVSSLRSFCRPDFLCNKAYLLLQVDRLPIRSVTCPLQACQCNTLPVEQGVLL